MKVKRQLAAAAMAALVTTWTVSWAAAEVRLPAIFTDHMVLQQQQADRVWGWAEPGESVTVQIAQQTKQTKAGDDGRWSVTLDPMPAGGPHTLVVKGKNTVTVKDVLVGEVWLCSGQSNMQFPVSAARDADLEILTADHPQIRLITVPQVGTQEPQHDFQGQWVVCSPETVADFSAVGYFYGRLLHRALGVPVGLIDNSWGGSACEAWVRRDLLEKDERYKPLLDRWRQIEQTFDYQKVLAEYQKKLEQWKERARKARAAGKPVPRQPRRPRNPLTGQHRPGNLYNGVLKPIIGYGIRGVIWYQGESNASRAYQYRDLFPLMIRSWRDEWGIGDFPFYWVQLADFRAEQPEPGESEWAELREAQTLTMLKLPNTGQAVIIDLGEANDIHPKNKQDVARRLVRWPLACIHGKSIPYQSPLYKSMEKKGNKIIVSFDHVGGGLVTVDVNEVKGFAIAGKDRKFVWAQARIVGKDRVEVWSDQVADPVAVRYAWADNPVCNLYSRERLPVTPFRTDDWPGITINNR